MGNEFDGKEFAVQVIAKGAFVDQPSEGGKTYLVETATVRVNHVALREWYKGISFVDREWFGTEEEWEHCKAERRALLQEFREKLGAAVGFAPGQGKENINVAQVVSEVFAVCWIHEVPSGQKLE